MSPSTIVPLLESLQCMALEHGATFCAAKTLLPMSARLNAKNEYEFGVLSCIAEVYGLICQTPDGRKAVFDLGFEPLFQNVECPGGGGGND